jgi:hypothetical protein
MATKDNEETWRAPCMSRLLSRDDSTNKLLELSSPSTKLTLVFGTPILSVVFGS